MTFDVTRSDERSFILTGELDVAETDRLRSMVQPEAVGDVTLHLQELTFIDSSGVSAIASIAAALDPGSTLVLCDPTPIVRRVLDLVRITELAPSIRIDPPSS